MTPAPLTPGEKKIPFNWKLGGFQNQSGRFREKKISCSWKGFCRVSFCVFSIFMYFYIPVLLYQLAKFIFELRLSFRPYELDKILLSFYKAEQNKHCSAVFERKIQFQNNFCTYQEMCVSSRRVWNLNILIKSLLLYVRKSD